MLLTSFAREIIFDSTVPSRWSVRHVSFFLSVLLQDVVCARKRLHAVLSLTLCNVTMQSIGFADIDISRQSKHDCSALDFYSVAPSCCAEICSQQNSKT